MPGRFDLVKVILAGVSAFLLLLTLIFIILFATKSTKSTAFIISFNGDFSTDSANKAIEKAFKDAKYTVRDVEVQEAGDGTWKGVVLVKGKQKVDDVTGKVKPDGAYSGLVIGTGSSAANICGVGGNPKPTLPPVTTPPTTSTVPPTTSEKATTTATPLGWCKDNTGPRDYVFVMDAIASTSLAENETNKIDVYGGLLDEMIQNIPVNARYAFLTIDGDQPDPTMPLTSDPINLKKGRDAVMGILKDANQTLDFQIMNIDYAAVADALDELKKKMTSTTPVSIILITDHVPNDKDAFFGLRNKGYFIRVLAGRSTNGYEDSTSAPLITFDTYADLTSDLIKTAMCTVNGDAPAAEAEETVVENWEIDFSAPANVNNFAASKTFECLTHDVVLVFDETQSIYNDTIGDWKLLAYKIMADFKWLSEVVGDDDPGVFTRFSVVVFGGLDHEDGFRQVDKSDDNDYSSEILFGLDEVNNLEAAKKKIMDNVYVYNGLTNITSALSAVQKVFDDAKSYNEAKYNRTQKRVVFTMTDGFLTADEEDATKEEAKILRDDYKADLWFVLAEFNAENADFPAAYKFAVEMADNKPERVFNSSQAAMTENNFESAYSKVYPCPPTRCKVVYFACENTEVLDPLLLGKSNFLCVNETLQLAEYINKNYANVTFRFLLYSTVNSTTLYPAQGEDDSYDNFKKQVSTLLDDKTRDVKHGGYTYLANALGVIADSFHQYEHKNPLVDGALFIAGQFEDGKIQDKGDLKRKAAELRDRFTHFYVMDRSDSRRALPYDNPEDGWGMVAPKDKIGKFQGIFKNDFDSLNNIGFFDMVKKLDCSLPPLIPCTKMFDVQFVFHFADGVGDDLWKEQKIVVDKLLNQFKAPYPVHLGAYFLADDMDVDMGIHSPDEIVQLIDVNATTTPSHDMSLWDPVIVNRYMRSTGCTKTDPAKDRPNVDNIVVIVSNDWSKWAKTAWTDVNNRMEAWKCKDCPNYPNFVFIDLNPDSTAADYPDLMFDHPVYRISNFNLQLREAYNQINQATEKICLPVVRDCCVDFPCKVYQGEAVCGRKSFLNQISTNSQEVF